METHKQDDSAYGKYVIQFRNKKKILHQLLKKTHQITDKKNFRSFILKQNKTSMIMKPAKGIHFNLTQSAIDRIPQVSQLVSIIQSINLILAPFNDSKPGIPCLLVTPCLSQHYFFKSY